MDLAYSQGRALAKDRFEKEEEPTIEREGVDVDKVYEDDVLQRCSDGSRILDIGTGTGHIPFRIAQKTKKAIEVVAMDLSECMVRIAKNNTASLHSIVAIRGDAHNLPFKDESFQVVMSKLTPCSIDEALRVLKPGGWYILQMSGLYDRWLEIEDVFGDRAYSSIWHSLRAYKTSWKRLEWFESHGLTSVQEKDFIIRDYYTLDQLIKQMEFDPIVKGFKKEKDLSLLKELKRRYLTSKGIQITKYPIIILGKKRNQEKLKHT